MWVCMKAIPVFHKKEDVIFVLPGEKFLLILNLGPLLPRKSESVETSSALYVRGLQTFFYVSFIGQGVIV